VTHFEALVILLGHRRRELEAAPASRTPLSRQTLEVCLRAVKIEVQSFVDGGTFEDRWPEFAATAVAGAELRAELNELDKRGE
jgi:hypothetical protein